MNTLRLATAIIAFAAGGTAHAVTLDTEGGLPAYQIVCTASSITGAGSSYSGNYNAEGSCVVLGVITVHFNGKAKFFRNPSYETGDAKEAVAVYADAAKTAKLGEILTSSECRTNPFIGWVEDPGPGCETVAVSNTTPFQFPWHSTPLMFGQMKHLVEQTGTGSQPLQEGQQQQDLSDWNPYSDEPQAQCVSIAAPGNNVHILAADPPGFNAKVVLVPKVRAPVSILGEFQKAELSTQVGDIVTDAPYPSSWNTISAPMSPTSPQQWSALQDAPGYANGRAVPLYTGNSDAPFTEGYYRVRVKAMQGSCDWEPWRYFRVTAGPKRQLTKAPQQSGAVTSGSQAAALKPGAKTRKLANAEKANVARSSLWIDMSRRLTMTEPELNEFFGVSMYIKNTGQAENSGVFQGMIVFSCTPTRGRGGCLRMLPDVQIPTIAPGESRRVSVPSAFMITQPGQYKLTLEIKPAPGRRMVSGLSASWSTDVTIEP